MALSMSVIKFLLVLLRYKTFNINFLWEAIFLRNIHFVFFFTIFLKTGLFCKVNCYFLYVIRSFIAWSRLFLATQTSLGVGVYSCIHADKLKFISRKSWSFLNMRSCKREPNIHIKRLTIMPLKKSFKIPFFMLIILFLLVVFLNSSFIFIFKGASESMTETNLTWPDFIFTIRYLINDFKHLLLML